MAKLSKSTRNTLVGAGVVLALGAVAAILLLTEPKDEGTGETAESSSTVSTSYTLTDRAGTDITLAKITNAEGSFSFMRDTRVVSTTDSEGNVTSSDEFYWTSEEMMGLTPNDSTIKAFMNCLAGLSSKELVEENAQDLAKYGLESPEATAEVTFEDGEQVTLHFGIKNPAATNYVYCRVGDSSDVYLASYYSIGDVYYAVTDFVSLTFTPSYNTSDPQELDYFRIERKDLSEPIEIAFMYDVQAATEADDSIITTFNSHRLTSPFVAEIDTTKGQTICYGLYGLSASYCVSAAASEELLAETGLDDPYLKLTFKYGGTRYVINFGNEIITTTETDDEAMPTLTTVAGYYAQLEGSNAIYAFTVDSVPWYTATLQDMVSRRPVSPYIYNCDSVVITTPEREYDFKITGEAGDSVFTLDGEQLNGDKFRQLYQQLISPIGDEIFMEDGDYAPYISVTFNYREAFHDFYGTESDTLEFFQSDDRKNIVCVNGKVLFKVRQIYTERMLENIDALLNGGELSLDW